MTSRIHSGRLAALIVLVALVATGLPLLGGPARAAETFSDQGTIATSNLFGISTTDTEWNLTCPEIPDSQGEDAWVFTLPDGFDVTGTTTLADGTTAGNDHDLDIYFYGSDCGFIDSAATDAADEQADTPAGAHWIVVTAFLGSDITVDLTVGPGGSDPSPTPTPTDSPSPDPTQPPGGERGTYPTEPNDPLFPSQDIILGGQWGMRTIQAPEAWQEQQATGFGVDVAVLDTGLDLDHPDFDCDGKVRLLPNSDYIEGAGDTDGPEDGDGHGTHVAGIVGACTNNGEGVVGVAPDARIVPIRVLDENGEGSFDTIPGAIRQAADSGAHVINMSLGAIQGVSVVDMVISLFPQVDAAVEYAVSKGVVVVAAAGNESFPVCGYPAIAEDIVCVGATDNRDLNSYFSNFPVKDDDQDTVGPALMAPGGSGQVFCDFHAEDIVSTYLVEADNCDEGYAGYRGLDGTSMASPHVAGVAALVYDRLGGVRTAENGQSVINALISTADDLYAPGYDPASGYGRVNALSAVLSVDPGLVDPSPTPTPQIESTTAAFSETVPSAGQFTDPVELSGTLTDSAGVPIADEILTFQLLGRDGFREVSATTDATGIASVTLPLDAPPGDYDLIVAYSGKPDTYDSSQDQRAFLIEPEDSAADLQVDGAGLRTLTAKLWDADDTQGSISQAVLSFYADGKFLGEAVTNDDGTATFEVPAGRYSKPQTTYEVRFSGNRFFLPVSATV